MYFLTYSIRNKYKLAQIMRSKLLNDKLMSN